MTKQQEIYYMLMKHSRRAIAVYIANMTNREAAEVIRVHRDDLGRAVSDAIIEEYAMVELADIMEWKRTRVRR